GRATAPHAVGVDPTGERVAARPGGRIAGRHHVDMAVEDQRAAPAGPFQDPHSVLPTGLDGKHVDGTTQALVEVCHETRDLAFSSHHLVVHFAWELRVDAGDAHGRAHGLDKLIL